MSFELRLDKSIVLQLTLPSTYPDQTNPNVKFIAPSLSKFEHQELQTTLNETLSTISESNEERLLEIVENFTNAIPSYTQLAEDPAPAPTSRSSSNEEKAATFIILIWFHHLLSTSKRKSILALDSLRGISKPGYPGILVLQGPKDLLEKAVAELKGMRWQAMQVRAEIEYNHTLLPEGIHEVESVAEVVEETTSLGLGDWCLSALRMK